MLYISYHDILEQENLHKPGPADPRKILHGLKAIQDDAIKW